MTNQRIFDRNIISFERWFVLKGAFLWYGLEMLESVPISLRDRSKATSQKQLVSTETVAFDRHSPFM